MCFKNWKKQLFNMGCGCMIVLAIAWVWTLWSLKKPIRSDEMLHLHNIWMVAQGELPYRDFFEHHAPWYHFLMAPMVWVFQPETGREEAVNFVNLMRTLSLVTVLCGLGVLTWIGRLWKDWWLGLMSVVILTGFPFFIEIAIETRPDVLAFLLWMGSILLIWVGMGQISCRIVLDRQSENAFDQFWKCCSPEFHSGWRSCPFLWAGLLLGSAVMLTQKMLFVLPGLGSALCGWALLSGDHSRIRLLLRFVVGCAAPTLLTWAFFSIQGAGTFFMDSVFLINTRWIDKPQRILDVWKLFLRDSWFLLVLGKFVALLILYSMMLQSKLDWFILSMIFTLVGWIIGLFWIIPVVDRQFYMIPLPLIAFLGAHGLQECLRVFLDSVKWIFRQVARKLWMIPEIFSTRCERFQRTWKKIQVFVFLASSLLIIMDPVANSWKTMESRDSNICFERALWVVEHTEPDDAVLDTFTGAGVFRPQAWYYGFIHSEILHIITQEDWEALEKFLESGVIQPELISFDFFLLRSNLLRWIKDHYEPARYGLMKRA